MMYKATDESEGVLSAIK